MADDDILRWQVGDVRVKREWEHTEKSLAAGLDWQVHVDADPEQGCATRRRLVEEHCDRDTLILGTHFAPPCAGHIVRLDGRAIFRTRG